MTVGQLIDKLQMYSPSMKVVLVDLSDDTGSKDEPLEDENIDESNGLIAISHGSMKD